MKSFLKTASRAVAALFAVALVTMGIASPAFADDVTSTVTGTVTSTITNKNSGKTYTDLATATAEAKSGETILLGEGNYTLYNLIPEGSTKDKDLTFEGAGADKTSWRIGPETPDPTKLGTEYNSDYSFKDAGTVTFKNMTLNSGKVDYLGFSHVKGQTVVDNCVINGKTDFWGYQGAKFKDTTFNAPNGDYALWTYCSPVMTFDTCTFNASGKVINVYTDYSAVKHDITVNVKNCTFNSETNWLFHKQALNINDSNMGNFKYILNITGINTVNFTGDSIKEARDKSTCSQLFGFADRPRYNTGRTDVNIDGKLVWSIGEKSVGEEGAGEKKTHSYTDGERDQAYAATYTDWTSDGAGIWTRKVTKTCNYCGYTEGPTEEKAYDLSYDLNGSEDEQTANFDTVKCVPEAKVTAEQPVRKGYSFVGWNTAKDGSGTSYAAGDTVKLSELSAPVTLYAQWKKDEPTPKPSDNKPSDNKPAGKPAKKTKANKQALPGTGDASANIVAAMGIMAIACFAASAVVSKVRK